MMKKTLLICFLLVFTVNCDRDRGSGLSTGGKGSQNQGALEENVATMEKSPVVGLAQSLGIPHEEGMTLQSIYSSIHVDAQHKLKAVKETSSQCQSSNLIKAQDLAQDRAFFDSISVDENLGDQRVTLIQEQINQNSTRQCQLKSLSLIAENTSNEFVNRLTDSAKNDAAVKRHKRIAFLLGRALYQENQRILQEIEAERLAEEQRQKDEALGKIQKLEQIRDKAVARLPEFQRVLEIRCPQRDLDYIICGEREKAVIRSANHYIGLANGVLGSFDDGDDPVEFVNVNGSELRRVTDELEYTEDDMHSEVVGENLEVPRAKIARIAEFKVNQLKEQFSGLTIAGKSSENRINIYGSSLRQLLGMYYQMKDVTNIYEYELANWSQALAGVKEMFNGLVTEEEYDAEFGRLADEKKYRELMKKSDMNEELEKEIKYRYSTIASAGEVYSFIRELRVNSRRMCDYMKDADNLKRYDIMLGLILMFRQLDQSIWDQIDAEDEKIRNCQSNDGITMSGYARALREFNKETLSQIEKFISETEEQMNK